MGKQFVETGDSDTLDREAATNNFLDAFIAPPITWGAGNTSTTIFLDGNNTKVSMLTKLIPSPDWFIGLDSINLCQDNHFIDSITTEVSIAHFVVSLSDQTRFLLGFPT